MEKLRYYLGANSPNGFYGYFDKAYGPGWRVWLLKGGPGSGKSTLMQRAAALAGGEWEYVHCSSDPKSLDAIIHPQKRLLVVDATAPHTLDARWPGCVEQIVNLGEGFDVAALREGAASVQALFAANGALHRRAVHWLAAAAAVQSARYAQGAAVLSTAAVRQLAGEYCQALLQEAALAAATTGNEREDPGADGVTNRQPAAAAAEECRRGLCAVTPEGICFFADTVAAVADTIYLLRDDWGAAAPLFLQAVRRQLLAAGLPLTSCYCSLFPDSRLEHLLLPSCRVAFVTVSAAHTLSGGRVIDLRGAYRTAPGQSGQLQRYRLQEQALLDGAADCMRQALAVHDRLEEHYIHAMDFGFAEKTATRLGETLHALLEA